MHKIELFFENTIRGLAGEGSSDNLNKFMRSHFCIFHHFKETAPNECATQDIFDMVDIFNKEL